MLMQLIAHDDPRLQVLLGDAHSRLEALRCEAEPRARAFYARVLGEDLGIDAVIERIFAEVAHDGDAAVARYMAAFDGVEADLRPVAADRCQAAWDACPNDLRHALTSSIAAVTAYQQRLLPVDFGTGDADPLGVRWLPLTRVGAYVPGGAGGSVPLVSSVIMNLVPARVAGVDELVMMTPPRPDGSLAPELLAAAHAVGVDAVYAIGGIPAIAAMACGTATILQVDKIVGPGNIFVTLAKRHAYGRVDIDMLAGPSEVLVISDGTTPPAWIAADLLSQAEHDELAMAVLVTVGDPAHRQAVVQEVERQVALLPKERRAVALASLSRHGLAIACPDLDAAIAIANRCAPEHLELLVASPATIAHRIRHAGALFIGPWSPEPIGDYLAGPSHTLPTGGSARIWSGIGADTFLRRMSVINFDRDRFFAQAEPAVVLARHEGLEAHARSILIRRHDGPAD